MNKSVKIVIFLGVVLLILIIMFLVIPPSELKTGRVCFNTNCFDVEIAKTVAQRREGLMYRESLEKNRGMLFIFDKEANYSFWMKDTLISLDIIWINQNNEVVFIQENAEPCREENCPNIDPKKEAKYVLEINGGLAKEINIKVGDVASLEI